MLIKSLSSGLPVEHSLRGKIGMALALTAASDILLYDRQIGWGLALLAWLILAVLTACNPPDLRSRQSQVLFITAIFITLALVESPGVIPSLLLALCALAFTLRRNAFWPDSTEDWVRLAIAFGLRLPGRFIIDALRLRRVVRRRPRPPLYRSLLRDWALPLGLGVIFTALLVQANPVIDSWRPALDWDRIAAFFRPQRVFFWLMGFMAIWAFLRPCHLRRPLARRPVPPALQRGVDGLFSARAVLRALILFNLIFLAQTATDLIYLWSAETLPEGLSYAGYAHRGAYPLIATALLAGAFTLIAFRDSAPAALSRPVRLLVFLWIGQNLFLTVNAIWRTLNYVEVYGLTYLRIAALIWMGLVACGLIFIICKISLGKSLRWLTDINAVNLIAVLCICSFVDFGGIVAGYNVRNSAELGGAGQPLDFTYLEEIGPDAIPALQLYIREAPLKARERRLAFHLLGNLERELRQTTEDWRGWSFRRQRLLNVLDNTAVGFRAAPPRVG